MLHILPARGRCRRILECGIPPPAAGSQQVPDQYPQRSVAPTPLVADASCRLNRSLNAADSLCHLPPYLRVPETGMRDGQLRRISSDRLVQAV